MTRLPARYRAPLLGLLTLVGVAACTGAGATTPSASPSGIPSSAGSTVPATPRASVDPDDRHTDPDLEARLPEVLGGVALVRESQLGTQLTRESDAFDTFLASVGGTLDDFSLASAYSGGGDVRAQVGAWRVRGADTSKLRDAFVAALQASSTTPLDVADVEVAGTPVTRIGSEGQMTQGSMYAWVDGDTILFVQTPDPPLAEEALTKLRRLAPSPGT